MNKQSLFRLIVLVILQSIIISYPTIHLATNNTKNIVDKIIRINSPFTPSQENSSLDLTPPIISRPDDISYLVNTTGHNITWYIADKNPGNYSIQHNYQDIDTEQNKTWLENQSISISIDNLPIGIHLYTIIVDDSWSNRNSDDVLVTVKEIANIPTFYYYTNNSDNLVNIAFMFFIFGIGLSFIIIIIISIIRYRRRQDLLLNLPPEDPLDLELLEDENYP